MIIARINPKTTAAQLKAMLKKLPWCRAKMIHGKTYLVRCGYVAATYPAFDLINNAYIIGGVI